MRHSHSPAKVFLAAFSVFFAFLTSSLFGEDTAEVKSILVQGVKNQTWDSEKIFFELELGNDVKENRIITEADKKLFEFKLKLSYKKQEGDTESVEGDPPSFKDLSSDPSYETNKRKNSTVFYTEKGSSTKVSSTGASYRVTILLSEGHVHSSSPKKMSLIDPRKPIEVKISFEGKEIKTLSIKRDFNEKYHLGNEALVGGGIKFLSGFRTLTIQAMDGTVDPILTFDHDSSKMDDTKTLAKDVDKQVEYVFFDVDGKTDNSSGPGHSNIAQPLHADVIDLLYQNSDGDRVPLEKAGADVYWADVLSDNATGFKGVDKTERCFFIYPSDTDLAAMTKPYECVRCNYSTDSSVSSADKAYLISSKSFKGNNKLGDQKAYQAGYSSRENVSVSDLENGRVYAVLPLFDGKTLIRYNKDKDPTANIAVGSTQSISSRVMCKLVTPEDDFTAGEMLGIDQDLTKKGKPQCFIATAAYGSSIDPHVDLFRWFRDRFILEFELGGKLMDFYYENSPPVADYIAQSPVLKFLVRLLLWPLVLLISGLKLALGLSAWFWLLTASLLSLALMLRRSFS